MNRIIPRLALALLLLFGCAPSNQMQNLVYPTQCENACWMGIEPNHSTAGEALEILEKIYGSQNVIRDEGAGIISWNAATENWQDRGLVFISNGTVDFVFVWFPDDNTSLVKDMIGEFGNPNSVGLVISGPVVKCAGASLLYLETGLQVHLSSVDGSVGIGETQIVNGFDIHAPWTSGNYPWTDTAVVPWDGYHEYCPEKWIWEE